MAKWEYIKIDYDIDNLNEMWKLWWELVQIIDWRYSQSPEFAILKRRIKRFRFFK